MPYCAEHMPWSPSQSGSVRKGVNMHMIIFHSETKCMGRGVIKLLPLTNIPKSMQDRA